MPWAFSNIKVGGALLLESLYFSWVHTKTYNLEASYMQSSLPLCSNCGWCQTVHNVCNRQLKKLMQQVFALGTRYRFLTLYYLSGMLSLLLSRFSRVRLCVTPQTAAHQAPPSLGFSRQEHWSGLPFPSPMHESEKESQVAQSCLTLSDSMNCSLPGSSVQGIFQARVVEWGAIVFHQKHSN